MEMTRLSVKCVPNKSLLMLLVRQTALYFNYNIQNCKRSFRISNTVREKYRFSQSTYREHTKSRRWSLYLQLLAHTLLCALSLLHKWQFYLVTQIINCRLARVLWNRTGDLAEWYQQGQGDVGILMAFTATFPPSAVHYVHKQALNNVPINLSRHSRCLFAVPLPVAHLGTSLAAIRCLCSYRTYTTNMASVFWLSVQDHVQLSDLFKFIAVYYVKNMK
jgi:hypothetical protein